MTSHRPGRVNYRKQKEGDAKDWELARGSKWIVEEFGTEWAREVNDLELRGMKRGYEANEFRIDQVGIYRRRGRNLVNCGWRRRHGLVGCGCNTTRAQSCEGLWPPYGEGDHKQDH